MEIWRVHINFWQGEDNPVNLPRPLPLYSTFRGVRTLENSLPTHIHTRSANRPRRAPATPVRLHRHGISPFTVVAGGNATTALLLIPFRFRAQLLSLPGQPPPVTYPIALSFSDHTQPRPRTRCRPARGGDKRTERGTATFRSTVRLSAVFPFFFGILFARNDRGQTPAADTMNRRRWPGRPPFNRVLATLAVIATATIVPQPPAAYAADDSLRSALEAISDKIGETQPPPRLVYLSPGKTDGGRQTRTDGRSRGTYSRLETR